MTFGRCCGSKEDSAYYYLSICHKILYLYYLFVDTFIVSQAQLWELESQVNVESLHTGHNVIMAQVFGLNRRRRVRGMES